ncbi:outer membrane lipoprotein-sorting protein [Alteromonas portus]|uniref:outer membrane lipoprotein-sorting protein n=1 Tax=Alteromonas portus TaxID=2565549 RepID=UPI003BF7A5EA
MAQKLYSLIVFISLLIFSCCESNAGTKQGDTEGYRIIQESLDIDQGWDSVTSEVFMVLKSKNNQVASRKLRINLLEKPNEGDKSLIIFDAPRDIEGTVLLTHSALEGDDKQWLYLPSTKRKKRISSNNKQGAFMGSEFSFEDLTPFEIEKYNYKLTTSEECQLGKCWVIEQYPKDENSRYSKRIVWLDLVFLRTVKIEFYDQTSSLLKTLKFKDYKQYLNKHWRASTSVMENHQTKKETTLNWNNFQFKTGIGEQNFNPSRLN